MVSIRCKMIVKEELDKLGLLYATVSLGEVELKEIITQNKRERLGIALKKSGLELMDDKRSLLIEKIKIIIIEMVHYADEFPKIKFSEYLSTKMNYDYTYLANLFSETEGTTIEHFIILHKIERVKELILYDEFNLSEIAWRLHYSSVGHLSNQFKKVTGLSPTFFKKLKDKKRNPIENV